MPSVYGETGEETTIGKSVAANVHLRIHAVAEDRHVVVGIAP